MELKPHPDDPTIWYSQGPDGEFDLHTSADDARAAAESMLEYNEDRAADGWHPDIGRLEWGRLQPVEVANIEETPAPEGSGFDAHWDVTLVPYQPTRRPNDPASGVRSSTGGKVKYDAGKEAAAQIAALVAGLPGDEALAAIGSAFIAVGTCIGIDRAEAVQALETVWADLEW